MAQNLQPYHIQQQTRRRSRLSPAFTAPTNNHEQPSSTPPLTFPSLLQLPPPQPLSSSSSSLHFQNVRDFPFNGHTMSSSPPNFNLNQPHYYYDSVSLLEDFFKQKRRSCEVMATSSVPFGPFTGYTSILMHSRFLKPAQQILDDYCGGGGGFYREATILSDFHNHHQLVDGFSETALLRDFLSFSDRIERSWKNSKLVFMLEEVHRKYRLYYQQIQSVVASFETVAGLGNVAPYIFTAFKAISKHFSCLKNAIIDQIQVPGKTIGDKNVGKDTNPALLIAQQNVHGSRNPEKSHRFLQYPVWRSQRGLPDHAVSLLKTWLFENFLHPYPTDSEKQILAQQTGLSRTQVSNWFINARVRLWKPMVEEIHKLEKQQSQTTSQASNLDVNMPSSDHQLNTLSSEKFPESTESQNPEIIPTKPPHQNKSISTTSMQSQQEPIIQNSPFRNLSSNQQNHIGVTQSSRAVIVSLALGLHQNIGNELSAGSGTINTARNFDLETDVRDDSMETGPEAQEPATS